MHNLPLIDEYYKKFIKDFNQLLPEGVYSVDLDLLYQFDLLHFQPLSSLHKNNSVTRYFQIIETSEKITLVNDQFIIWIVPHRLNEMPVTYSLIALNQEEGEPKLETAFVTTGVYNSSKLVLKILEKFLGEIQETELLINKLEHSQN